MMLDRAPTGYSQMANTKKVTIVLHRRIDHMSSSHRGDSDPMTGDKEMTPAVHHDV